MSHTATAGGPDLSTLLEGINQALVQANEPEVFANTENVQRLEQAVRRLESSLNDNTQLLRLVSEAISNQGHLLAALHSRQQQTGDSIQLIARSIERLQEQVLSQFSYQAHWNSVIDTKLRALSSTSPLPASSFAHRSPINHAAGSASATPERNNTTAFPSTSAHDIYSLAGPLALASAIPAAHVQHNLLVQQQRQQLQVQMIEDKKQLEKQLRSEQGLLESLSLAQDQGTPAPKPTPLDAALHAGMFKPANACLASSESNGKVRNGSQQASGPAIKPKQTEAAHTTPAQESAAAATSSPPQTKPAGSTVPAMTAKKQLPSASGGAPHIQRHSPARQAAKASAASTKGAVAEAAANRKSPSPSSLSFTPRSEAAEPSSPRPSARASRFTQLGDSSSRQNICALDMSSDCSTIKGKPKHMLDRIGSLEGPSSKRERVSSPLHNVFSVGLHGDSECDSELEEGMIGYVLQTSPTKSIDRAPSHTGGSSPSSLSGDIQCQTRPSPDEQLDMRSGSSPERRVEHAAALGHQALETAPRDANGHEITSHRLNAVMGPFFFIRLSDVSSVYSMFFRCQAIRPGVRQSQFGKAIAGLAGFESWQVPGNVAQGMLGSGAGYVARSPSDEAYIRLRKLLTRKLFRFAVVPEPHLCFSVLTMACCSIKEIEPAVVSAMFSQATGKRVEELRIATKEGVQKMSIQALWARLSEWALRLCSFLAEEKRMQRALCLAERCNEVYQTKYENEANNGSINHVVDEEGRIACQMLRDDEENSRLFLGVRSDDLKGLYQYLPFIMKDLVPERTMSYLTHISESFIQDPGY